MPYAIATVTPSGAETEYDSGDYRITLDRCLEEFGWAEKQRLQGKLIDGRYHGLAIGCFIEGGAAGPKENARLALEPDGRVTVVGRLGRRRARDSRPPSRRSPPTRWNCRWSASPASSTARPRCWREGYGAYHSRSIVMGGSAILAGGGGVQDGAARSRGKALGCDASRGRDSSTARPGQVGRLGDVCGRWPPTASPRTAASTTITTPMPMARTPPMSRSIRAPGRSTLVDYVAVEDVGRIINPMMVHGQQIGAIVQGLGGALARAPRL